MTTTSNRPSHVVSIVDGEGDNATWTEISAIWPHKAFNLSLKAVQLIGSLATHRSFRT